MYSAVPIEWELDIYNFRYLGITFCVFFSCWQVFIMQPEGLSDFLKSFQLILPDQMFNLNFKFVKNLICCCLMCLNWFVFWNYFVLTLVSVKNQQKSAIFYICFRTSFFFSNFNTNFTTMKIQDSTIAELFELLKNLKPFELKQNQNSENFRGFLFIKICRFCNCLT